jgi:hypothetical protein
MMFREGALVVLAGVIVLAAAGSMSRGTRPWLPKVLGWMLALICYKPAAALVYASAITLVGEGDDPRTVVVGLTMMLLALVALPALMKLFTWATGSASAGGGGLSSVAGASVAAIYAGVALRSAPHSSAASQANHLRSDLGPVAGVSTSGAAGASAPLSFGGEPLRSATTTVGASVSGMGSPTAAGTGAAASAAGTAAPVAAALGAAGSATKAAAEAATDYVTGDGPR